jgi:hypothetical protein
LFSARARRPSAPGHRIVTQIVSVYIIVVVAVRASECYTCALMYSVRAREKEREREKEWERDENIFVCNAVRSWNENVGPLQLVVTRKSASSDTCPLKSFDIKTGPSDFTDVVLPIVLLAASEEACGRDWSRSKVTVIIYDRDRRMSPSRHHRSRPHCVPPYRCSNKSYLVAANLNYLC